MGWEAALGLVHSLKGVRVLCVGDVMLDRFVHGAVRRISPEAPIPVFSMTGRDALPGGAANVGRNVATLGGQCGLIGVVGVDEAGVELQRLIANCPGLTSSRRAVAGRPTTEKTRFVSNGQQLLRVDHETGEPVLADVEAAILAIIETRAGDHDVIVISDYAKGALTDRVVAGAIAIAQRAGLPIVIDPKSARLDRYAGATIVTPNSSETLRWTGIDPRENIDAERAGVAALSQSNIDAILITRAERGSTLVARGEPPVHIPASARSVFDVVGAGDTVAATLALALGAGGSFAEAASLANVAAGIVVGKRGTATVTFGELIAELDRQRGALNALPSLEKAASRDNAAARAKGWREAGLKVGFTNGCFDLLHAGHIALLEFARAHCDRLIVGLNSDASVSRLKGPERPLTSAADRSTLLGALAMVDAVVVFEEDTPLELIKALEPDALIKGADYAPADIVGADFVIARGGVALTCPLVPGRATTNIVAKMRMKATP